MLRSSLRQLREADGLTQETVAERSGLHQTAISALETGRRKNPSWATVVKLAAGLARPVNLVAEALNGRRFRSHELKRRRPTARRRLS